MLRKIFVTVQQITQWSKRTISTKYLRLTWPTCSAPSYRNPANLKVRQMKMLSSDSSAFLQKSTLKSTNSWTICPTKRSIRLRTSPSRSSKPRATLIPRNCLTAQSKLSQFQPSRKPLQRAALFSLQKSNHLHRPSPKWLALINTVSSRWCFTPCKETLRPNAASSHSMNRLLTAPHHKLSKISRLRRSKCLKRPHQILLVNSQWLQNWPQTSLWTSAPKSMKKRLLPGNVKTRKRSKGKRIRK